MNDRSRWDAEMAANQAAYDDEAAKHPPIRLEMPLDPHRAVNDRINEVWARGGPTMAETTDRWVAARGRRILCRVHKPRTDRALPTLVYFHGGGWVWSSVDTHDRLTRELAAAGDVAVVSVDYALSPEAKFPQALEECAAVVRHFAAHGADWGLDGSRLLLGGDSAGGNLALGTALMLRDTNGPRARGILAIYPVCDNDFSRPSYEEFGTGHGLTREKMEFYWTVYVPHAADRAHPWAAPLRADLRGLPPVMVLSAELDVLASEGAALHAKLEAAGVPAVLDVVPGVVHGFMRATGTVTRAREAVARAGAWLARHAGDDA
jgi:acetyl esterase